MKSDIWSMACIFAELYTGEMFFDTRENIEHLALMEKACGPFPRHMADRSLEKFRKCFDLTLTEKQVMRKGGHRMDWPRVAKKKDSINNYEDMITLDVMHHLF
jgi:hypothetical protein